MHLPVSPHLAKKALCDLVELFHLSVRGIASWEGA